MNMKAAPTCWKRGGPNVGGHVSSARHEVVVVLCLSSVQEERHASPVSDLRVGRPRAGQDQTGSTGVVGLEDKQSTSNNTGVYSNILQPAFVSGCFYIILKQVLL